MKRLMIILFAIGMTTMSSTCMAGMSKSRVRKEARFLTDKMSYELDLSSGQRNDTYEINYDFIYSVRDLMDDVLDGEEWAMERYYYLLDIRNDDLRWVLNDRQYRRLLQADYFYRPIYASGNDWGFRIYFTYSNYNLFFFGKPYHYTSYHCNHYRHNYDHASYYRNRYSHTVYINSHNVRDRRVHNNYRVSDFSSVKIRPNTSKPAESVNANRRPNASRTNTGTSSSVNSNSSRRTNSSTATRPSTGTGQTNKVSSSASSSSSNRRGTGTSSSSVSVESSSSKRGTGASSSSVESSSSKRSTGASNSSVKSSSSGSSTNKSSSSSDSSSRSNSSNSNSNSGSGRSNSKR